MNSFPKSTPSKNSGILKTYLNKNFLGQSINKLIEEKE